VSRDAQLYIGDVVAAGEAILRYTDEVAFQVFVDNDEKRAAVERQLSSLAWRRPVCRKSGSCACRRCRGARSWDCGT
jgi:hypothetical protein